MNKYTRKLPKDDLKRLAKEISKKLVASDYKNNRISDPTVIPSDRARGARLAARALSSSSLACCASA